jgi:hypothetical protein
MIICFVRLWSVVQLSVNAQNNDVTLVLSLHSNAAPVHGLVQSEPENQIADLFRGI